MYIKVVMFLLGVALLISGCAGPGILPDIGSNMSNPQTIVVDSARNRLYVINSNYMVSYEDGSIHIVDISDPTNPVRVSYTTMPSFSGDIYLDTVGELLYTPNRYSSSNVDTVDNLYRFDVNEASANFLGRSDYTSGDDPYGIACCDAANRIIVASEAGQIDYYDLDDNLAHGTLSLTTELSSGVTFSGVGATRVLITGNQAVVTREGGGLWIISLDKLGVSGAQSVDYLISDVTSPRGIATDGAFLYVADKEVVNNAEVLSLLVLDISTLTPRVDNTTTLVVDKDDSGLLVAGINLGDSDPQEVVLSGTTAYVSHMAADIISVVDIAGYTKTSEISVGDGPFGMALYSPGGVATHLFVANTGSNTVSAIDLTTNGVVGTYP